MLITLGGSSETDDRRTVAIARSSSYSWWENYSRLDWELQLEYCVVFENRLLGNFCDASKTIIGHVADLLYLFFNRILQNLSVSAIRSSNWYFELLAY